LGNRQLPELRHGPELFLNTLKLYRLKSFEASLKCRFLSLRAC
jgi:hypothetical protein